MDPDLTVIDAAAMNFAPAAGSPGINAARETALWEDQPATPQWQYVHPMCVQPRTAVGEADSGAFEYGLPAGTLTCGAGNPAVARLASLELHSPYATEGAAIEGVVRLTSPADGLGLPVALSSDLPALAESGTLFIPGGESAASFSAPTPVVEARTERWLRAEFGGEQRTVTVILLPKNVEPAKLVSISGDGRFVTPGQPVALTLTLDRPAQPGGVRIALATSNPDVGRTPESITIPESASSAEFQVEALHTNTSMPLAVSASADSGPALRYVLWVIPEGRPARTPRPA
jgi:hypothetical protein